MKRGRSQWHKTTVASMETNPARQAYDCFDAKHTRDGKSHKTMVKPQTTIDLPYDYIWPLEPSSLESIYHVWNWHKARALAGTCPGWRQTTRSDSGLFSTKPNIQNDFKLRDPTPTTPCHSTPPRRPKTERSEPWLIIQYCHSTETSLDYALRPGTQQTDTRPKSR